jgi:type III secretion system low calcium response chaperone LcrH/SycD
VEKIMVDGSKAGGLTAFQMGALAKMKEGSAIKDIVGLSAADIETVHRIGTSFAEQGKYDQAEPMFQFACLNDHAQPRYWSSLANCRQMLKKYPEAIDAYALALLLEPTNPWPPTYMAVCSLAMQDKQSAGRALAIAEGVIADGAPNEAARQRIAALRQAL